MLERIGDAWLAAAGMGHPAMPGRSDSVFPFAPPVSFAVDQIGRRIFGARRLVCLESRFKRTFVDAMKKPFYMPGNILAGLTVEGNKAQPYLWLRQVLGRGTTSDTWRQVVAGRYGQDKPLGSCAPRVSTLMEWPAIPGPEDCARRSLRADLHTAPITQTNESRC